MLYFDIVERYWEGKLDDEELKRFEERLKTDPQFARDVKLYCEVMSVLGTRTDEIGNIINEEERFRQKLINEANLKIVQSKAGNILEITRYYFRETEKADAVKWLYNEAVLYPELIECLILGINEKRFYAKELTDNEVLNVYDSLLHIYSQYCDIEKSVDSHLILRSANYDESPSNKVSNKKSDEKEVSGPAPYMKKRRKLRRKYAIAAFISLLIICTVTFTVLRLTPDKNSRIFAENYLHIDAPATERGTETTVFSEYSKGATAFNKGEYNKAISYFKSVPESSPDYQASRLFMGLSNIEIGQHQEAVLYFDLVIYSGNTGITHDALWYKALCLIYLHRNDEAIQCLEHLISSGSFYKGNSVTIIDQLKK